MIDIIIDRKPNWQQLNAFAKHNRVGICKFCNTTLMYKCTICVYDLLNKQCNYFLGLCCAMVELHFVIYRFDFIYKFMYHASWYTNKFDLLSDRRDNVRNYIVWEYLILKEHFIYVIQYLVLIKCTMIPLIWIFDEPLGRTLTLGVSRNLQGHILPAT